MELSSITQAKRLLVVIPCLNEGATIAEVICAIPRQIPGISAVDVLIVDDGSADNTASEAARAGAAVLKHPVNYGVGAAFQSAVDYAVKHKYDLMVNIDGDKQFNPLDIPQLVNPVLNGQAAMATASRFLNPATTVGIPYVKLIGNRMMSRLISHLVRLKYSDVSCGFRCYSREALLRLNLHGAFTYTQETFLDFAVKRLKIVEVPIRVEYFKDRKSRVAGSIWKYAVNTSKIIFRGYRDYFPLRCFWSISAVFAVPGLVLAAVFFIHFLMTGKFSGYLFAGFTSAFLIMMATVFFIIGMVADMFDRIRRNQERILYLLKSKD